MNRTLLLLLFCLTVVLCFDVVIESVSEPSVITRDIPFRLPFSFAIADPDYTVHSGSVVEFVVESNSKPLVTHEHTVTDDLVQTLEIKEITVESVGRHELSLRCLSCPNPTSYSFKVNAIPGFLTIVPQICIIILAIVTKQVIPSLFIGLLIASTAVHNFNPLTGLFESVSSYLSYALADVGHAKLILFFIILGGLIGIVSRSGGSLGLSRKISKVATSSTKAMFGLALMTLTVFVDEFSNVLLTGLAVRPVLARLRVSPEKISFLLDSLAAPLSAIGVITSWIGFQVSLLRSELAANGLDNDPFILFLQSIPYSFYPIVAAAFVVINISLKRDYGPMYECELKARGVDPNSNCKVEEGKQDELSDHEDKHMAADLTKPTRAINAVLPIFVTIVAVISLMVYTGYVEISDTRIHFETQIEVYNAIDNEEMVKKYEELLDQESFAVSNLFGNASVFDALLQGSICGVLMSMILNLCQKIATLEQNMNAFIAGFKSLSSSIIIILFAWAIGSASRVLGTAPWLVSLIPEGFSAVLLVTSVFIASALVSFSTGTAWGTMSILIPLVVPLAVGAAPGDMVVLRAMVASVLSGSVFGNHSSPLGDTTVIAAMAARCNLLSHVRTQIPYALTVASVVVVFGYVPTLLFSLHPLISIGLCFIACFVVLRFVGKPVPVFYIEKEDEKDAEDTEMKGLSSTEVVAIEEKQLIDKEMVDTVENIEDEAELEESRVEVAVDLQ
ncbi:hypothetical protein P9112_010664 [Eukaryota sp. TZLM1-RC]